MIRQSGQVRSRTLLSSQEGSKQMGVEGAAGAGEGFPASEPSRANQGKTLSETSVFRIETSPLHKREAEIPQNPLLQLPKAPLVFFCPEQ